MSSSEVHNLAVRLTPEGADETQQALDGTADSFERTADRSEEASRDLNRFSRKFTGALAVAGGVLSGIAGKFLSMVPAVQDAFIGISSVIDGLIMQFEDQFGPAIRDVGDDFFALAEDVRGADSFLEAVEIAATGTIDIVDDLRQSLLRAAGEYAAEFTIDVTQRVTTILTDPEEQTRIAQDIESRLAEQFRPEPFARRTLRATPFAGGALPIAEPFARGFMDETRTQRRRAQLLDQPSGTGFTDPGVTGDMETPATGRRTAPPGGVDTATGDEQVRALNTIVRLLQGEQRREIGATDDTTTETLVIGDDSSTGGNLTAGGS